MGLAMQYKENSKKRTTGTNLSPTSHMADFVRKFLGNPIKIRDFKTSAM